MGTFKLLIKMSLKFGTDGVRSSCRPLYGVGNQSRYFVDVLQSDTAVIGSDGRESGKDFVSALRTGFESEGLSVWYMGTVPTPALAHAAATHGIAGAMVSASHNLQKIMVLNYFLLEERN